MKIYGEWRYSSTSAMDGSELSASCPGLFTSEEMVSATSKPTKGYERIHNGYFPIEYIYNPTDILLFLLLHYIL
jgi:hypothetical protein